MIELNNVSIIKENKVILNSINCTLPNNGLVFIKGKSGSGKTSLLNALTDSIEYSGTIIYDGIKQEGEYIRQYFSQVKQHDDLFDELTAVQNIKLSSMIVGKSIDESKIDEYLEYFNLKESKNKKCKILSGGEKRRISFIKALTKQSNVIIVDEITNGLDQQNVEKMMFLLKQESKNKLILIVEHNDNIVEKYSDYVIELSKGNIVFSNLNSSIIKINEDSYINNKNKIIPFITKLLVFNQKWLFALIGVFGMILSIMIMCSVNILSVNIDHNIIELVERYKCPVFIDESKNETINKTYFADLELYYNLPDKYLSRNHQDIYCHINEEFTVGYYDDINDINYKIVGSIPKENEVLISEYLYSKYEHLGYSNERIYNYYDVIGKKIICNGNELVISGIFINDAFNIDSVNNCFYESNLNVNITNDYIDILNYSLAQTIFVSDLKVIDTDSIMYLYSFNSENIKNTKYTSVFDSYSSHYEESKEYLLKYQMPVIMICLIIFIAIYVLYFVFTINNSKHELMLLRSNGMSIMNIQKMYMLLNLYLDCFFVISYIVGLIFANKCIDLYVMKQSTFPINISFLKNNYLSIALILTIILLCQLISYVICKKKINMKICSIENK